MLPFMGGERASTTRKRAQGKICAICSPPLDAPPWKNGQEPRGYGARERLCHRCLARRQVHVLADPSTGVHRVHLGFFLRGDAVRGPQWFVQFSPPALDPLRIWSNEQTIRDLIAHTPTPLYSNAQHELDEAFHLGRAGIWLTLTPEQYGMPLRG